VQIFIFGRPTTKKNHGQIILLPPIVPGGKKRRAFTSSKQFKAYQELALEQLAIQRKQRPTIDFPVWVRVLYYFKDGRQADLNNLTQATADILQRSEILTNDNLIVSWDGTRMFYKCHDHVTSIDIYRMLPINIEEYSYNLKEALILKEKYGLM
jgi:Holliday junction resolvase RusA-like endonuclease